MRTFNIWLAAFLMTKGIVLKRIETNDGKAEFHFDMEVGEFNRFKMEFIDSESLKTKQNVDKLKDFIYAK